ncbi:MAG: hypothetical protein VW599_12590, partial [Pseudomonadales bacterium]
VIEGLRDLNEGCLNEKGFAPSSVECAPTPRRQNGSFELELNKVVPGALPTKSQLDSPGARE